jgi:hypothetical protein
MICLSVCSIASRYREKLAVRRVDVYNRLRQSEGTSDNQVPNSVKVDFVILKLLSRSFEAVIS